MTSLKARIGQLEQAPVLRGSLDLQESIRMTAQQNLSAIRNRCRMILEVTEDDALADDLRGVIAAIDEGRYPAPAPLPSDLNAKAKEMHRMMMEQFGE